MPVSLRTLFERERHDSCPPSISASGSERCRRCPVIHANCGGADLPDTTRSLGCRLSAGGSADLVARLIGQQLAEKLSQPIIVENRAGAGNNLATEAVVRAAADGYTLLLVNPANAINATLYDKLSFNFLQDIAPVAGVMRVPNVAVVHPSVPAGSIAAFIAYAKANPGKINMASSGNGVPSHVAGELFKMMAGVDMVHVPYRGSAPALTDLLGGQVQVMFDPLPSSIDHIRTGRLVPWR